MCSNSFAQGPGIFDFDNNTSCAVSVTVFSYNGGCGDFDCDGYVDDVTKTVLAFSTEQFTTTIGDTWGHVEVTGGESTTYDGDASCFSKQYTVNCYPEDPGVTWANCHHATLP